MPSCIRLLKCVQTTYECVDEIYSVVVAVSSSPYRREQTKEEKKPKHSRPRVPFMCMCADRRLGVTYRHETIQHLSLYWRKCVVQFRFTIFFYFFSAFEHVFCDDGNVLWLKRSVRMCLCLWRYCVGTALVHNMFLIVFVHGLYRWRFIMAADENPKIN